MKEFLVEQLPTLLAMLPLLAASAFFSGSETALFSLSSLQLHQLASRGGSGALVGRLMRYPRRVLVTVLLGNMFVNVLIFAMFSMLVLKLHRRFGAAAATAATVVSVLVVIIFCEVLPKSLCVLARRRIAPLVAPPLYALQHLLRPIQWLLTTLLVVPITRLALGKSGEQNARQRVTVDELRQLLHASERSGAITTEEFSLLAEVLELSQLRVCDVMVPRVDIVAFDLNRPVEQLHELIRNSRKRRIPVYRDDIDNVEGFVTARQVLLEPNRPLKELIRPIQYVPELKTVESLLAYFRDTRTTLAVVVDEYGGVAGLVTLQDVLEEIVGEILEPHEKPELIRTVGPFTYELPGGLAFRDWAEVLGAPPSQRFATLGGFVTSLLGRLPRAGDVVRYRNAQFRVLAVQGRRIKQIELKLIDDRGRLLPPIREDES